MSKLFRRMFAQPGFRLCVVLLLASGVLVGQEGRRPTLEGGVRQQERRPTTVKGGVRQQEELPDEFSLLKAAESQCRDAREALDLYHRAAADTKLVLSDDWNGVDERLYAGMASCIECPMAELKVYIELLRKLQIARPDPRARAELYRQVVSLESGNEPARGPASLQAYDQAVEKWRQKIQETLKGAEGCFRESCTETLQAMRDALPPDRPLRGGVSGQDGGGRGARRSDGDLPPMPPPLTGGSVRRDGNEPRRPRRDPWGLPSAEAQTPPDMPDSILDKPVTSSGPGRSEILDGAIIIEGDDDFRRAILREIETIASTPPGCAGSVHPGAKLLYALQDSHSRGRTVTIKTVTPDEVARQRAGFELNKAQGKATTPEFIVGPKTRAVPTRACCDSVGASVVVMFDPDQFPLPNGNDTPAHVALFHELVHALHFMSGRGSEETRPDPRQPGQPARDFPSMEEFNTIAAKVDFTENSYRRCWKLRLRTDQHFGTF